MPLYTPKILIACEESQTVTSLLIEKGINAYSCDIEPTRGKYKNKHIQTDVREILYDDWETVIAFPPCTDLCVSGARWFKEKQLDGRQQSAIDFFMLFTRLKCKWAIENPVGIMSKLYRKPDQYIQPYEYGHGETKKTCLWLNNLPLLKPTNFVWKREARIHYLPPGKDRSRIRSETYIGIAEGMADQWF